MGINECFKMWLKHYVELTKWRIPPENILCGISLTRVESGKGWDLKG